jgi:DNA invertase Pin-like site-specific DNA recombinase
LSRYAEGGAQSIDTTKPSGKATFQMMGVPAEFERELIRPRTTGEG